MGGGLSFRRTSRRLELIVDRRKESHGVASIKVAIADGNTLLREGLKRFLAAERDLRVVQETGDGDAVVYIVEQNSPDVLLLDLEIAKQKTVHSLEELKRKGISTKILVLCSFPDQQDILDTAKAGARGFILKRTHPSMLIQAIRKIQAGEIWVDRQVKCAEAFMEIARRTYVATGSSENEITTVLSRRELEILTLLAKGLANAEIAKQLFVSPQTVKQHLHHIFRKLNVTNRTQAALLLRQSHRGKP